MSADAIDQVINFHNWECKDPECTAGSDARAELSALRAAKEQTEKVIALNKYVVPPFDLTDDATVQLALKCVELERERDEARAQFAKAIRALTDISDAGSEAWGENRPCVQQARAVIAEDINQPATLTPRRCRTCCTEAAKAMREAAASVSSTCDQHEPGNYGKGVTDATKWIVASIRVLPLPSCDGCNPLKTEDAPKPQSQAALRDQLNALIELANVNGLYDAADFVANKRGYEK